MVKKWISKAIEYLDSSLCPVPQELNELDWKRELSSDNKKICRHLSAFANHPGGGFLVYGIENSTAKLLGVTKEQAEVIMQKLSSLCRDSVTPLVNLDHAIENYRGVPLLFIHIRESAVKPVSVSPKSLEDAYIRSAGTTRQASRQELGALSCAYNLNEFDDLARKNVRVIRYKGVTKRETEREQLGSKGYAIGYEGLIHYVKTLLPSSEIIKNALRTETTVYPDIALRELIANALIHQDFAIRGASPMIEIFDDRIEISNPGRLLPSKKIDRLIRTTPESRNEILASAFRRYGICEERGSGFEKAVAAIELYGLPPLKFEELENSFRVTMYSPKPFAKLTPSERVEACYQHSIICYFSSRSMTNSSLRERFKMSERQRPQVSLVIKEALAQNKIKPKDPNNASTKFVEYIPIWG